MVSDWFHALNARAIGTSTASAAAAASTNAAGKRNPRQFGQFEVMAEKWCWLGWADDLECADFEGH